jgi:hypothetical protein
MKEKVRERGGTFEARSADKGTEIIAKIPIGSHAGPQSSSTFQSVL